MRIRERRRRHRLVSLRGRSAGPRRARPDRRARDPSVGRAGRAARAARSARARSRPGAGRAVGAGGGGGARQRAALLQRPRAGELREDHRRQGAPRGGAAAPRGGLGRAAGAGRGHRRRDDAPGARPLHHQSAEGGPPRPHLHRLSAQRPRAPPRWPPTRRARSRARRCRRRSPGAELSAKTDPAAFTVATVPKRLATLRKDPWADFFSVDQAITARTATALAPPAAPPPAPRRSGRARSRPGRS